jgi:hypothetical protein
MLYKANFDEFCKKLTRLKTDESLDFATEAEEDDRGKVIQGSASDWYGVTRLNLFDCDRIIIASYGGNPEFIITLNGGPSDPHEYLWDDMQQVFLAMFGLNKFEEDGLAVYIEDKSDAEILTDIIRKYGYRVENAFDGLEVSNDDYTIGCVVQASPDKDVDGTEMTDFFTYSGDTGTDGNLYEFRTGFPNAYEVLQVVGAAFDEEREYQFNKQQREESE